MTLGRHQPEASTAPRRHPSGEGFGSFPGTSGGRGGRIGCCDQGHFDQAATACAACSRTSVWTLTTSALTAPGAPLANAASKEACTSASDFAAKLAETRPCTSAARPGSLEIASSPVCSNCCSMSACRSGRRCEQVLAWARRVGVSGEVGVSRLVRSQSRRTVLFCRR